METGITRLSVAGFKSIARETALDIKPLTLLAGANSSGKSSFMQPLLLLKQTLAVPYDPGPLLLNGGNVKFTSFDQMLTVVENESLKGEFSVTLEASRTKVTLLFSKKAGAITVSVQGSGFLDARIDSNMGSKELLEAMKTLSNEPMQCYKDGQYLGKGTFKEHARIIDEWEIVRRYCFLTIFSKDRTFTLEFCSPDFFSRIIVNVIHVPGLRGNPERIYQAAGFGPTFPGTFENYTANVISDWEEKKSGKLKQLCSQLIRLGLTSRISARRLNDAQVEVMVGRLPENGRNKADMVNIADIGFGVSQVLPVLVALLVAEPEQLVYLEQPEIHLHPRAQRALADILVEAANRGVKVVVETHSSMLLLAVQTLIAKQKIDHNNVAMHWFQRNKTGMTEAKTAELDDSGRFGEWPVDFGAVELEAEEEYIEMVSQKAFQQLENTKGGRP